MFDWFANLGGWSWAILGLVLIGGEMLAPGVVVAFEGYLHQTEGLELRAERITIGDLTVELR